MDIYTGQAFREDGEGSVWTRVEDIGVMAGSAVPRVQMEKVMDSYTGQAFREDGEGSVWPRVAGQG